MLLVVLCIGLIPSTSTRGENVKMKMKPIHEIGLNHSDEEPFKSVLSFPMVDVSNLTILSWSAVHIDS